MTDRRSSALIYRPQNLQQLLQNYKKYNKATLFAGGTFLTLGQTQGDLSFANELMYLGDIPELNKISRTERFLDIGACASLNQILEIGRHLLPKSLYLCLKQIGTLTLRNRATLGGNICVKQQRMDSYPVLQLMDVRLELRKIGASRWVQLNRFFDDDNRCILEPGEIVSRIRIPLEQWDIQVYRKIGSRTLNPRNSLIFCGLAKLQKGMVQDFRVGFGGMKTVIIRMKTLEAEVIGKKLPLQFKNIENVEASLQKRIEQAGPQITVFQKNRIFKLIRWFIDLISEEY